MLDIDMSGDLLCQVCMYVHKHIGLGAQYIHTSAVQVGHRPQPHATFDGEMFILEPWHDVV